MKENLQQEKEGEDLLKENLQPISFQEAILEEQRNIPARCSVRRSLQQGICTMALENLYYLVEGKCRLVMPNGCYSGFRSHSECVVLNP